METLKLGQNFTLGSQIGVVKESGSSGYYLNFPGVNGLIFKSRGIDKRELQKKVLGYEDKIGDFPYCKTLEDLTKFALAIKGIVDPCEEQAKEPAELLRLGTVKHIGGYEFVVKSNSDGFYLSCRTTSNDVLFTTYGINKMSLQKSVLGYSDGDGRFPFCKTMKDLTIYVKALEEIVASKKSNPSASYSTEPTKETPAYSTEPTKKDSTDSYKIDVSPEPIKRTDRLRTFLLIN
jgi:hypothetical protein